MTEQGQYAIIIGAMKCGTTTLFSLLAQHPQICPCTIKEPEFFSSDSAFASQALSAYESLWNYDPSRHRYALEASTGYSKYPGKGDPASAIFDSGLRPRFIYLVRDPCKRALSDYNFSLNKPWFDANTAITDERYLGISRYYTQLSHYAERFGRDQILVLDFDTLTTQPETALQQVVDFLGLSNYAFADVRDIANKTPPINRWQALGSQSQLLRRAKASLPSSLKQFIQRSLPTANLNKTALSKTEVDTIRAALADEMHLFKTHFGFPIEHWGF